MNKTGEETMRRSTDRILTTHVGSLPRPDELIDVMIAQDKGEMVDAASFENKLKGAVGNVVKKQAELGVDIVDDGEFSKRGFAVYAHERLGGLEPTGKSRPSPWADSRESRAFPEFYAPEKAAKDKKPTPSSMQMACTSALNYKGQALLDRDLSNLRAAADANGIEEAFVPAISCSDIAGNQVNEHLAATMIFCTQSPMP